MFIKFILNKPYKHIIRGEINLKYTELLEKLQEENKEHIDIYTIYK